MEVLLLAPPFSSFLRKIAVMAIADEATRSAILSGVNSALPLMTACPIVAGEALDGQL